VPVFSHSRIVTFEVCPLRYKLSYIDLVEPDAEETPETYLDSRVNEALERLYRNVERGKLISKKELLSFFKIQWKTNWPESILVAGEALAEEEYRKRGERYLKDYYEKYKPFKEGKIAALETTDCLSLDEEGQFEYYVRIKRLMDKGQGLYEIHEYRINPTLPSQEFLDKEPQLAMYSLWVRREFEDCRDVRLVWHFLTLNKEMESWRTEKQLENLRKEILGKVKAIEAAKEFPARLSGFCNSCLCQGRCQQWIKFKDG
jgi:hypothetical protein